LYQRAGGGGGGGGQRGGEWDAERKGNSKCINPGKDVQHCGRMRRTARVKRSPPHGGKKIKQGTHRSKNAIKKTIGATKKIQLARDPDYLGTARPGVDRKR